MSQATRSQTTLGTWAAVLSFVLWGVLPLYWVALDRVPSLQILLHRIVWSAALVAAFLFWRDGRRWLTTSTAHQPRLRWLLGVSGLLIAINWGLYIWAVNAGHVVETALGYFINPLVNVLIGVVFLRERLRPLQWLSVLIALGGVLWLALQYGHFPWIALTLAFSFGVYGLLRKLAPVDAVAGLGIESAWLLLPALAWLGWIEAHGDGGFGAGFGAFCTSLLVLSGLVTALPLVGFAYAVRRIPLTSVGILQYIAPTLQFLIGVLVLREPFARSEFIGFLCIWVALAIFVADGLRTRQAADEPEVT